MNFWEPSVSETLYVIALFLFARSCWRRSPAGLPPMTRTSEPTNQSAPQAMSRRQRKGTDHGSL